MIEQLTHVLFYAWIVITVLILIAIALTHKDWTRLSATRMLVYTERGEVVYGKVPQCVNGDCRHIDGDWWVPLPPMMGGEEDDC